jgi:hypothetical protein
VSGARISPTVQGSGATQYRCGKIFPMHDSPPRVHDVRFASGSTIVDPDQNGSRGAEAAGIAADPIFGEVWLFCTS